MLRLYLKIWEWDLIFGRAVKAISSPGVRSPWAWTTHSQALHFTCKIKQGGNFNRLGLPSNTAALEVARVCVNKCVLSRFENIINSSLNCITTKSVGDLPLRSLGFLLPRHLVPSPSYCGTISQKLAKYLLYKNFQSWLIQIHMLYYWISIWNCWSERELKIICQFWTKKVLVVAKELFTSVIVFFVF